MTFEEWLNDTYIGLSSPVQLAELAFNAGFKAAKNEEDRAMLDAIVTGTGVLKDGKRIDPKDLYVAPTQEPVATVVRNVYGRISADFLDESLQHGAKLFTTPTGAAEKIAELQRQLDWVRDITAEFFGIDAPFGDGCNPLREMLQSLTEKAEAARSQEPVAWVAMTDGYITGFGVPVRDVPLYALPPDAAKQIADLQNQYDLVTTELRGKIAKLEEEVKFRIDSHKNLDAEYCRKLEQIIKLVRENVEYAQYITVLESQRGGWDVEVKMLDVLNDQNQRLQEQIDKLEDQITIRTTTNRNLHQIITERDALIAKLEAERVPLRIEFEHVIVRQEIDNRKAREAAQMALDAMNEHGTSYLNHEDQYAEAMGALKEVLK